MNTATAMRHLEADTSLSMRDLNRTKLMDLVQSCAKGDYQRNLVVGTDSWSGSSLRGAAKNWGGEYAQSRANLEQRIRDTLDHYTIIVDNDMAFYSDPRRVRRDLILYMDGHRYAWAGGDLIPLEWSEANNRMEEVRDDG